MTISLSLQELASVTGGRLCVADARVTFSGVEFDSRAIKGGELFIALKGAAAHGHTFLATAFAQGAAAALIEDSAVVEGSPDAERCVVVRDSLAAFSALASYWRKTCALPTIAVTGSVGKTTTKEILAAILMQRGVGNYSQKSFNNHTGVPYTILRTARHHQWLILEMGMNHAGEIRTLATLSSPDVGVITTIAPAHIENFADIHGIADAKCEIFSGLPAGGPIVLNRDDGVLCAAADRADPSKQFRRVFFGGHPESKELRIVEVQSHGLEGLEVTLQLPDGMLTARVGILGRHNVTNIAAAVAGARALLPDLTLQELEAGLRAFRAPLMRLNLKKLRDGKILIDDSYNANPASMSGMLGIARELAAEGLRVGLVLGDMRELGSGTEQYHRALGQQVGELQPEFLIVVGEQARYIEGEAKLRGVRSTHAASPEAAAHLVEKTTFDVVIVKGSRGIQLDRTSAQLVERMGSVLP